MHVVNKVIFILCLLFMVSTVSAKEYEDKEENDVAMILLAQEKMKLAILESDKKIGVCLVKEKDAALSPQDFPKLPLSNDEWKTALAYLYYQAAHRCEEAALATALMAVSQYKYIVKKISGLSLAELLKKSGYQAPKGEDLLDHISKKITGKSLTEHLKNGDDQSPKGEDSLDVAELFYFPVDIQLKYEVKYRKIDPKARQLLEAIPALNKPFNPLVANEALGLNPH